MGNLTLNELSNSLNDYMDEKQNMEDHSLMTENKTIVSAINEIYGKQLIADAIGEPLDSSDTFSAMSNDINGLLSTFKTNMMNNGVTVESGDKFKQLIDKIATMVEEGSGKGIQFAEGTINNFSFSKNYQTLDFSADIGFIPTYFFVHCGFINDQYSGTRLYNVAISNIKTTNISDISQIINTKLTLTNITETGFSILGSQGASNETMYSPSFYHVTWYAIGVGEEDTALRDSLASILENKGVDVTEEDDMASLITKVDGFIPHPPAIAGDDHIIYENTNVFTGYNQDGIGKLISEFNNFKIGGTYRIYFSSHSSGGHSSRPYYEHIRNSTVINTGQTYGGGWYAEVSTFDVPNVLPGDTIRFYMNSSASDWEVDKHGIRCSIDDSYFLI